MFFFSCFFIDFCAAIISPLFWLLHPWAFSTWPCRYKHGGNEQQSKERGCMCTNSLHIMFVVRAYLWHYWSHQTHFVLPHCLFPSKGVPVRSERSASEHRSADLSGVSYRPSANTVRQDTGVAQQGVFSLCQAWKLAVKNQTKRKIIIVSSIPETWAITADGCMLCQPVWAEHQSLPCYEPLPGISHRPC